MWMWPREGWPALKPSPAEMGRTYPGGPLMKAPSGAFCARKAPRGRAAPPSKLTPGVKDNVCLPFSLYK